MDVEIAPPFPLRAEHFLNVHPETERDVCLESNENTPPSPLCLSMDSNTLSVIVTVGTEYVELERVKRGVDGVTNEEKVEFAMEREERLAVR